MDKNSINKIIIDVINQNDDETVKKLVKNALQYELDNWNRAGFRKYIINDYKKILDKCVKGGK